MCWGTLGTVRPFSNFHPDRDVMEIQAALEKKGKSAAFGKPDIIILSIDPLLNVLFCTIPGSDAVTLVRILTNRSNEQRQMIASTFEDMTQKVSLNRKTLHLNTKTSNSEEMFHNPKPHPKANINHVMQ